MSDDRPADGAADPKEGTLEYRSAAADYTPVRRRQVFGGIVIAVLLGAGAVFVAVLTMLGHNASTVPAFVIGGAAAVLINLWACLAYRDPARRGFAIGLWIGFGLIGLIKGACSA
jgi:hypothetical protein